jgi:hypothetical protein
MKIQKRWGGATAVLLCVLWCTGLALAQDEGDPPGRVMRLQYTAGAVSLQPGGVDDWVGANLNRPLTTADRIWVDDGGRAELTMASAVARLGGLTSLTVTNLDDQTAQLELDQGTMVLHVRTLGQGEIVEVDTPNFAFTVESPGEYRFEVYPDLDQSWVTVRRGAGEATGDGNAVPMVGGQQFRFRQGQSLAYSPGGAPRPDGFDDWCGVREQREVGSASLRYVAPGTIGYADLDGNGDWAMAGEYGAVWYPRVGPDWAPYRAGHWAWVEPWGWTWVDDAPWGFAPFHYGRWAVVGGRWGWIPGPRTERPVYAPALVAWVGGVSVGVGGGVGWFPLGWHDPFIPSYHVSAGYARQVNVSSSRVVNVTVINNYYNTTNINVRNTTINNIHYDNASARGAVTGVPSAAFAAGRPVAQSAVVIPPGAVHPGAMMAAATVVPTKEAVLGGHAPAAAPARLVVPRQVVANRTPPPRPVSFDQQKPLLEQSKGAPLAPAQRANLRESAPAPKAAAGRAPVAVVPARPAAAAPARMTPAAPARPAAAPTIAPAPARPTDRSAPPARMATPPPATAPKASAPVQPKVEERPAPQPARPAAVPPKVEERQAPQSSRPAAASPKPAPPAPAARQAAPLPAKKDAPPPKENKKDEKKDER